MASTWQEYPEQVAAFFRSIGLDATTNHTAKGVRTTHDIDVFVRSHQVGFDVVWIVECKQWSKPVNTLPTLAWIGAFSSARLVSRAERRRRQL